MEEKIYSAMDYGQLEKEFKIEEIRAIARQILPCIKTTKEYVIQ